MILFLLLLFFLFWAACGILAYGLTLAYLQGNWPGLAEEGYKKDAGFAFLIALLGPIGLLISYFCGDLGKHGWRLR